MPSRLPLAVSPESSWANAAIAFSGSRGGFCAQAATEKSDKETAMANLRPTRASQRSVRHSSETEESCRVFHESLWPPGAQRRSSGAGPKLLVLGFTPSHREAGSIA